MLGLLKRRKKEPELTLKDVRENYLEREYEVLAPEKAERILNAKRKLYGCEFEASQMLLTKLWESDIAKCIADVPYPRIDLSFMGRHRKQRGIPFPVPLFAPFSLLSPHIKIWAGWGPLTGRVQSDLQAQHSAKLLRYFHNVMLSTRAYMMDYVEKRWKRRNRIDVELNAKFSGVIPDGVRENIETAVQEHDLVVGLVCEVKEWSMEESVSIDPDPLVIGFRTVYQDHDTGKRFPYKVAFLVDAFDLTPAEEYVMREFAS